MSLACTLMAVGWFGRWLTLSPARPSLSRPSLSQSPPPHIPTVIDINIDWPDSLSVVDAMEKDLICRFLTESPTSRIGTNGGNEVKKHPYFGTESWEVDYSTNGIFGQAASTEKKADADRFVSPVEISPDIVRDFKEACKNAADRQRQRIAIARKGAKKGGGGDGGVGSGSLGSGNLPGKGSGGSAENSASSSMDFADFSYVNFDQLAIMNMADMAAQQPKSDGTPSPSSAQRKMAGGAMSGLPEMEAVG